MKTYTIVPKASALDWSAVPEADIDCCQWGYFADISSKAQLCYDEEAIYVRLRAREANIRAEVNEQTGLPYFDSCLEFFFCPMEGNDTYFNIEMNPNCAMFLGIGTSNYDLIRLILPEDGNFEATSVRTEDGCPAGIAIPDVFSLMNQKLANEGAPETDYAALPVQADACLECGKCEAVCPQHLHIRKLLKEVTKSFPSS